MKNLWIKIQSAFFWSTIILVTLFFSTSIILCAILLFPFDPNRKTAHQFAVAWGKSVFSINPHWKLKIRGRGYIRNQKSYILTANHASMSDIICLFCLNKQFKWVAKDSLFRIPFFGWAMSALGYIKLHRSRHGSIRDSFKECVAWIQKEMSVLIFPEGTRNSSGGLGVFKNGAFKLAIQTGRPIVPIVLTGTKNAIQKGKKSISDNVYCTVQVLKPIDTSGYQVNEFGKLKDLVRARMLEALKE